MLYEELAAGEYILCRLVEHEAQGADIGTHTAGVAYVHKLHVTVLPNPELQPQRGVDDHGGDYGILEVESELREYLEERTAFRETLCLIVVRTAYLQHFFQWIINILCKVTNNSEIFCNFATNLYKS